MLINNMTPKNYVKDRTFLFFNPIYNLKQAFSKNNTRVDSYKLEIISDIELIKNFMSENKTNQKPILNTNKKTFNSTISLLDVEILSILSKVN